MKTKLRAPMIAVSMLMAAISVGCGDSSSAGSPANNGNSGSTEATPDAATQPTPDSGASAVADGGGAAPMSEAGAVGTGGDGGSLKSECKAQCTAQMPLDCSDTVDNCTNNCLAGEAMTGTTMSCAKQYDALAVCESGLSQSQWMCSSNTNPIPVAGACMTTLCKWACCVGSLIPDGDVWTACHPSCP